MVQQARGQEQERERGRTQFAVANLRSALNDLLTETFELVEGNFLDPGTSLFETLSQVSAEEASRSASPKVATLAAQVEHVSYYLKVLDRHIRAGGNDAHLTTDWSAAWQRRTVSVDEWAGLIQELQDAYAAIRQTLMDNSNWHTDVIGGFLGILAHSAYHLGEIRQALGVIRA